MQNTAKKISATQKKLNIRSANACTCVNPEKEIKHCDLKSKELNAATCSIIFIWRVPCLKFRYRLRNTRMHSPNLLLMCSCLFNMENHQNQHACGYLYFWDLDLECIRVFSRSLCHSPINLFVILYLSVNTGNNVQDCTGIYKPNM